MQFCEQLSAAVDVIIGQEEEKVGVHFIILCLF